MSVVVKYVSKLIRENQVVGLSPECPNLGRGCILTKFWYLLLYALSRSSRGRACLSTLLHGSSQRQFLTCIKSVLSCMTCWVTSRARDPTKTMTQIHLVVVVKVDGPCYGPWHDDLHGPVYRTLQGGLYVAPFLLCNRRLDDKDKKVIGVFIVVRAR